MEVAARRSDDDRSNARLTGACPGPLLALIGNGAGVMAVARVSATVGTWAYGALRPRLPQ